jgi:hypothetical protein
MMNIIRADVYRLAHGKALYITFAFLTVMMLFFVFAGGGVSVGLAPENLGLASGAMTVSSSIGTAGVLLFNTNVVIYFIPVLVVAVTASTFSSGAAKNEISTGMSRIKIYLAKSALSVLFGWIALTLFIWGGVLSSIVLHGAGDWSGEFMAYVLKAFASQLLVITAYTCVALFLSFVLRNTGAVTGIYIAFCLVPQIVITLVCQALKNQELQMELLKYDLATLLQMYPAINILSSDEIVRSYAIAACYILAAMAGGITLFRKAEIK